MFTAVLVQGGRDELGVGVRFKTSRFYTRYSFILRRVSILYGRKRDGLWQTPIRNPWCFTLLYTTPGDYPTVPSIPSGCKAPPRAPRLKLPGFVGCLTPSCKADKNHFIDLRKSQPFCFFLLVLITKIHHFDH